MASSRDGTLGKSTVAGVDAGSHSRGDDAGRLCWGEAQRADADKPADQTGNRAGTSSFSHESASSHLENPLHV
jgi:hypothetical protein